MKKFAQGLGVAALLSMYIVRELLCALAVFGVVFVLVGLLLAGLWAVGACVESLGI